MSSKAVSYWLETTPYQLKVSARIITEDCPTRAFPKLNGVAQGDILAPYLFVIAIDYVMTTAPRAKGQRSWVLCSPQKKQMIPSS